MTRHLDPDRSPPVELFPFPIDIETGVCNRCLALVPMTDKARENHRDHHRQVDALAAGFATVALTSQLSGSGSNAEPTGSESPGPDSNVPTPEQEVTAGRSGVEGAKHSLQADAAGHPPGSVTAPLASSPREARGIVTRAEMLKAWEPLAESVPDDLGGAMRSRPVGSRGRPAAGRLRPPLDPGDPARFAR